MALTINVNDLTLCHKQSDGVSTATLPDVCNTPPGSQAVGYPNTAYSTDLVKGTTSVLADGGNMCANHGSEFEKSTGDEPGELGGVVSGVNMAEASWISFSFDVKLEGKGACRLTDKMFHNHQNTVNAAGLVQDPLEKLDEELIKCLRELCRTDPDVLEKMREKQSRVWSRDPKKMKVRVVGKNGKLEEREIVSGGSHSIGQIWINRRTKVNPNDKKEKVLDYETWCMNAKRSAYHEAHHAGQGSTMKYCDKEVDAYTATEAWAIRRGLPGPAALRFPGGRSVNPAGVLKFVKDNYTCKFDDEGKALPVQIDKINDDGTVRMTDGSVVEAQEGDLTSKVIADQDLQEREISHDDLDCSKKWKPKGK